VTRDRATAPGDARWRAQAAGRLKPAEDQSTEGVTFGGQRGVAMSSESVAERKPPPQDRKRWHDVATDDRWSG
jgi:hypothetical protein